MALIRRRRTVFPGISELRLAKRNLDESPLCQSRITTGLRQFLLPCSENVAPEVGSGVELSNRVPLERRIPVQVDPYGAAEAKWKLQYVQPVNIQLGNPWKMYRELATEKSAHGEQVICIKSPVGVDNVDLRTGLYMVSEQQKPAEANLRLRRVISPYIIDLVDIFLAHPDQLYLVYDYIDVSLRDVLVGPYCSDSVDFNCPLLDTRSTGGGVRLPEPGNHPPE